MLASESRLAAHENKAAPYVGWPARYNTRPLVKRVGGNAHSFGKKAGRGLPCSPRCQPPDARERRDATLWLLAELKRGKSVEQGELDRLAELRRTGVISRREFNRKKKELLFGPQKKRGLIWKILAVVAIIIGVLGFIGDQKNSSQTNSPSATPMASSNEPGPAHQTDVATSQQADTPECASDLAKTNVQNTFAEQPDTSVRLKFLDWKDIKQVSYDPKTQERKCQGYFIFNSESQEGKYNYRFYYATSTSDSWLIEIKPIDAAADGASGTAGK